MSTPSSELPPPLPPGGAQPTHIAGQQSTPTTSVPHTPGLVVQTAQNNTLAVVSLVCGILSYFAHIIPGLGGGIVAVVAIITGYMARNQIKQTGEGGMTMATIGMILGIVNLSLTIVGIVLIILIFVFGLALFGIAASHSSG